MKTIPAVCLAFGLCLFTRAWAGPLLALSERLQTQVEIQYGGEARQRLARWQALMLEGAAAPLPERLAGVNRFFNRIPYVPDQHNWGATDYWATPFELLAVNGGDCEDYAIAKYFSLVEMGVPAAHLHITYVQAVDRGEAHMVLAYAPGGEAEPLILDNLTDTIKPASQRRDLMPLYVFNSESLWRAQTHGRGERLGRPERIAQWLDLLVRMNREIRRGDLAARGGAGLRETLAPAASGPPR